MKKNALTGANARTFATESWEDCGNVVSMWLHFTQICCRKLEDYASDKYLT